MAASVKARDVRVAVRELGFEAGVVNILERLCEERNGDREVLRDLVQLTARCIDEVAKMIEVGDSMKGQLEEVKRREQQFRTIDNVPTSDGG